MAKKNSDNSSSCKPRRKPTVKQLRFAATYVDPLGANGNGVVAARIAGYRGDAGQLATQASVNLKNRNVQQTIAAMVDALVEPALHRVAEAMDATKTKSMLSKNGEIVSTAPEPDHRIRLDAVQFLFQVRSRFGPLGHAEEKERVVGNNNPSRDEAIEAAKECLQTFAPQLLADKSKAIEADGEPSNESSDGNE